MGRKQTVGVIGSAAAVAWMNGEEEDGPISTQFNVLSLSQGLVRVDEESAIDKIWLR